MPTIFIEVRSPPPDHHARLFPAAEPLDAQALVPDFAVEAFARAVLPRLARLDQAGLDAFIRDPLEQRERYELRVIVRTQNVGWPSLRDKAGCRSHHASGSIRRHRSPGARALIDHRQTLDLMVGRDVVEHEVIGGSLC
jgi:hypothetical protein